jgi:hypothetical protein
MGAEQAIMETMGEHAEGTWVADGAKTVRTEMMRILEMMLV